MDTKERFFKLPWTNSCAQREVPVEKNDEGQIKDLPVVVELDDSPVDDKNDDSHSNSNKANRLYNGVYLKGLIEDVPVVFTADTGASKTLISSRVYNKIKEDVRPKLRKTASLRAANGKPILDWGEAQFTMTLGTLEVVKEAKVADIEDDVLLGYDVLGCGEGGAADILLSEDKIVLDGVEIPCFQVGKSEAARKVVVAEKFTVPGQSEALVDVFVKRSENDDIDESAEYIIEATDNFKERYKLLMATSLVNINSGVTCKVRVLNPFSSEVILRQDAEIGKAEKIEEVVSIVAQEENENEGSNLNQIRRVGIRKAHSHSETFLEVDDVPPHLKDLFDRSSADRSETENSGFRVVNKEHLPSTHFAEENRNVSSVEMQTKTRDQSPRGMKTRDYSPRDTKMRDQLPTETNMRDQSPRGMKTRGQSPKGMKTRDQSPRGMKTSNQSSRVTKTSDQSSRGTKTRDQSPNHDGVKTTRAD